MNFSYFRTNKQRSMSRPTQSRSHSTLWKIKGASKDLSFKEKEMMGEQPPTPASGRGLCGSRPLAGVLGPGLGGQGSLESRGAGHLPEAPAPWGSARKALCSEVPLTLLSAPASEPVREAFLGRGLPWLGCASKLPGSSPAAASEPKAGARAPACGGQAMAPAGRATCLKDAPHLCAAQGSPWSQDT